MRLNIQTKLLGGFGTVLLLTAVVAFMGFRTLGTAGAALRAIDKEHFPQFRDSSAVAMLIAEVGMNLRTAVLQSDPAEIESALKTADEGLAEIEEALKSLRSIDKSREEADLLAKAESAYEKYRDKVKSLEAGIRQNTPESKAVATKEITGPMTVLFSATDDLFEEMSQGSATTIDEFTMAADASAQSSGKMLVAIAAVAVLAGMAIGFYISRTISNGVGQVKRAAEGIAAGDLVQSLDVKSNDEIGDMADAFKRMIAFLSGVLTEVRQTAESLDDARGRLAGLAGEASEATESVAKGSEEVARAASEVARTTTQLAQGAGEQATGVQDVNRAVEELSNAIVQVTEGAQQQARAVEDINGVSTVVAADAGKMAAQAQEAADGARTASHTAEEGAQSVGKTVAGIHRIQQALEQASREVGELGARSTEIGKIVSVIEDIAAQTNLLALNAAIEAARAGEQGRGFAVVADEVRQLAERSANATKEIATLIQSVQAGVSSSVEAMRQGTQEMTAGTAAATEAGEALQRILDASHAVSEQIAQIAASATRMQDSGQQMAQRIADIRGVVEQNSAAAEEMQATSSSVGSAIASIASIAEENSAATEQVSASTEEMAASAEEMTAGAASLREQVVQVNQAATELGTLSEVLAQQVAAFKLDATGSGAAAAAKPARNVASPVDLTRRRRAA
ncbi:MAG: methyl-accepting chemotaxis protein [Vicinamibacterales bacterium]|nr:methyl-accepting chemotaxis protein [Vicinamibacterales bacterium]